MRGANPGPPALSCASRVGLALGPRWEMLTATCVTPWAGVQAPRWAAPGYSSRGRLCRSRVQGWAWFAVVGDFWVLSSV